MNSDTKTETSCGCIIFNGDKVLLEYQKHGQDTYWTFPKGHIEGNETEKESAIREVKEETGLDVEILDDTPFEVNYYIQDVNVNKIVKLFLAKPLEANQNLVRQEAEVDSLEWLDFSQAREKLTYDSTRTLWDKALSFYTQNYS